MTLYRTGTVKTARIPTSSRPATLRKCPVGAIMSDTASLMEEKQSEVPTAGASQAASPRVHKNFQDFDSSSLKIVSSGALG